MSEQVNPSIALGERIFKDLAWDMAVQGVLAYLFSGAPWLAPFKRIISALVTHFTDKLFEFLRLEFDVTAIGILRADHRAAYERASATLKIMAIDHGIESPQFQQAREAAKLALSKFGRFNQ